MDYSRDFLCRDPKIYSNPIWNGPNLKWMSNSESAWWITYLLSIVCATKCIDYEYSAQRDPPTYTHKPNTVKTHLEEPALQE